VAARCCRGSPTTNIHLMAAAAAGESLDLAGSGNLTQLTGWPGTGWIRVTGAGIELTRSDIDRVEAVRPVRVQHRSGALWTLNTPAVELLTRALTGAERASGGGIVANGVATGLYIGAGLGPGPRDGLMTGLAARGHSIRVVRTAIELSVLGAGWLLGGSVGVGTVGYALAIGPLAHYFIPRFAMRSASDGSSGTSGSASDLAGPDTATPQPPIRTDSPPCSTVGTGTAARSSCPATA
jgi:hypothetical protein